MTSERISVPNFEWKWLAGGVCETLRKVAYLIIPDESMSKPILSVIPALQKYNNTDEYS